MLTKKRIGKWSTIIKPTNLQNVVSGVHHLQHISYSVSLWSWILWSLILSGKRHTPNVPYFEYTDLVASSDGTYTDGHRELILSSQSWCRCCPSPSICITTRDCWVHKMRCSSCKRHICHEEHECQIWFFYDLLRFSVLNLYPRGQRQTDG